MRRATLVKFLVPTALLVVTMWVAQGAIGAGAGPTTVPRQAAGQAVDAPGGKTRPADTNRNITNKNGAQSETSIAVDPTDPKHVAAASNDLSSFSTYNGVYESFDAGRTWRNSNINLNIFCYDPWVDFNAEGDLFFAYECGDQRIAYKLKGSNTWVHQLLVNNSPFPDRDMVVVADNARSPRFGSVYVSYDEAAFGNRAKVSYSADGFGGWAQSPKINDIGATIGVNAAVSPDGTLYASWLDWNAKRLYVDRSLNGGATWSTDDIVHTYRINTQSFFISIPPQPDRGIVPMPMSDVIHTGPFAGRLLITYTDKAPTSADTHTYVRWSDDQGNTWSPEIKVDDDLSGAYHFHPQIAVNNDGRVGISFYSTRGDPADRLTNQYIAFSDDGGVTWLPNVKVTSAPSDESGAGDPNDYGDYQGLDATSHPKGWFHPVWTDSRPVANAEDMWTARARP
jgi:hypothetical protein